MGRRCPGRSRHSLTQRDRRPVRGQHAAVHGDGDGEDGRGQDRQEVRGGREGQLQRGGEGQAGGAGHSHRRDPVLPPHVPGQLQGVCWRKGLRGSLLQPCPSRWINLESRIKIILSFHWLSTTNKKQREGKKKKKKKKKK